MVVGLTCVSARSSRLSKSSYGAARARIGESLALLGWNVSVADFRWSGDFVLVDIDAAPSAEPDVAGPAGAAPHAKAEDIRGVYGYSRGPESGMCGRAVGDP